MKKFLLTAFLILSTTLVFPQLLPLRIYNPDDGLSSSQVWSITQDTQGYMWFGCSSGISRFNGFEFKNFRTKDGLPSGAITNLITTKDNKLLAITVKEISIKTNRNGKFFKLHDIGEIIDATMLNLTLKNGEKTTLVFATVKNRGINSFNIEIKKWKYAGFKELHPLAIANYKGNLIFSTEKGEIYLYSPTTKKSAKLAVIKGIKKIKTRGTAKCLLIGEHEIYLLSRDKIKKIADTENQNEIYFDASIDSKGNLWIGTNLGLRKINKNKSQLYTPHNGLPGKRVLSVYESSEKILWFGTNHGVCKLMSENIFVFKNPFSNEPLAYFCFYYDKTKNDMMLGTSSGTYSILNGNFKPVNSPYLHKFPIWAIKKDKTRNLYFATEGGGVIKRLPDGRELYFRKENGCLPGNNVTDILVKKDTIFFATKHGFAVLKNGKWKTYDITDGLPVSYIRCLENYKNDSILMATLGGGILIYKNGKFRPLLMKTPPELKAVYDIYYDKNKDIVWAATNYGLIKISNSKIKKYFTESGFLPFGLSCIFPVKQYLWIGSDGGAQLFDPKTERIIKILTRDDGLPGNEFTTHNAIAKDDNNRIWFGFFGGAASIEKLGLQTKHSRFNPKVFITGVSYFFNGKTTRININTLKQGEITIPYGAKEIFISFDTIWYKNEYSLKLQYKLKGLNTSWNCLKNFKDMKIYYTSLSPGKYSLYVKLSSISTSRSSILNLLHITIPAPWWMQKKYIFISITLFFIFLSLLVFIYTETKTKKLKKEKEKLNRMVMERTKELKRLNEELEVKNLKLKEMAEKDFLTGLYNRRFFMEKLSLLKNIAERENNFPICIIIFDIDNFKQVNDTYGHNAGDEVLKVIGGIIKKNVKRKSDIAARYGGEEFIVALIKSNREAALNIAESIRKEVESTKIQIDSITLTLTISGGVHCIDLSKATGNQLNNAIEKADKKLYLAKNRGKNRIEG